MMEELRDLKAVWTALSGVWAQIAEVREMNWATVQVSLCCNGIDVFLVELTACFVCFLSLANFDSSLTAF